MSRTIEVKLIHGQSYTLGNRKFEYSIPQIVDGKMADYLEANATHSAKVTSGNKTVRKELPKFEFRVLDEEVDGPEVDGDEDTDVDADNGPAETAKAAPAPVPKPKAKTAAPAKRRQRGTKANAGGAQATA